MNVSTLTRAERAELLALWDEAVGWERLSVQAEHIENSMSVWIADASGFDWSIRTRLETPYRVARGF